MRLRMNVIHFLLIIQGAAYGPVWCWYASRMVDCSDEPWGVLSLVTAVALVLRRPAVRLGRQTLWAPSVLMILYAASYPYVPHLVRAGLAVTSLGCTLSMVRFRTVLDAPTVGLLVLSLPIMSSLQFYLGYPLRVISGSLSVPLLQLGGLSVALEGTCMRWGSDLVAIDVPCSGVKMLWAGLFLTLIAASTKALSPGRTLLAVSGATMCVIMANALRAAALFYMEAGIVTLPGWFHDGIGLSIFFGVALVTLCLVHRLSGGNVCVELSHT